jgi:hypothetical protein
MKCINWTSTFYWLNAEIPLKEYGFLEKNAFWDSLYLRYNIPLRNLPSECVHALSCTKGGFMNIQHNEFHDFTASSCQNATRMFEWSLCWHFWRERISHSPPQSEQTRLRYTLQGGLDWRADFHVKVFDRITKTYLALEKRKWEKESLQPPGPASGRSNFHSVCLR